MCTDASGDGRDDDGEQHAGSANLLYDVDVSACTQAVAAAASRRESAQVLHLHGDVLQQNYQVTIIPNDVGDMLAACHHLVH